MRVILLTQSQHTVVDDDVFEWANKFKWGASKVRHTFYAVRMVRLPNGKQTRQYLHREILKAPSGVQADHIDGDGLHNLRENLRLCSNVENRRNGRKSRNNTSGYKGVVFRRRDADWVACIRVDSILKHIGCFDAAEQAARAYDRAALEHFGVFARLNFPATIK